MQWAHNRITGVKTITTASQCMVTPCIVMIYDQAIFYTTRPELKEAAEM